jgi:hypothetical protein
MLDAPKGDTLRIQASAVRIRTGTRANHSNGVGSALCLPKPIQTRPKLPFALIWVFPFTRTGFDFIPLKKCASHSGFASGIQGRVFLALEQLSPL